MAPVALNVAPGLRPWRQAGIARLLLDAPLAEALLAAAPSGNARPQSKTAAPSGNARLQPKTAAPRKEEARPVPAPPSEPVHADPEKPIWSAAWQSLWTQMSVSGKRPALVWTYAELGTDLRGQADAGRRQVLQSLIAELRLPKGSHAFWPYCLPPDNAPESDMFLAGITRFRPGLVLLAGGQAAADLAGLGPLPSVSFQIADCRGFRFILLPALSEAAKMAGPRRARHITFIRTAVS